jgi:hypothetical protein
MGEKKEGSPPPKGGGSPKKRSFSLFWEIPLKGGSFYPSLHFILLFPHPGKSQLRWDPFRGISQKSEKKVKKLSFN